MIAFAKIFAFFICGGIQITKDCQWTVPLLGDVHNVLIKGRLIARIMVSPALLFINPSEHAFNMYLLTVPSALRSHLFEEKN